MSVADARAPPASLVLASITCAERDAEEQIRQLTQRKDELLVELGGVREALEALHVSKRQLSALRGLTLEDDVFAALEDDAPEMEISGGAELDCSEPSGSAAVGPPLPTTGPRAKIV